MHREAQIGPDMPREAQMNTERPREAQGGPERPREAQGGPDRLREAQGCQDMPKRGLEGAQRGLELGILLSVACGMYRYVLYGCVSVAWEIASNAYSDTFHRLSTAISQATDTHL